MKNKDGKKTQKEDTEDQYLEEFPLDEVINSLESVSPNELIYRIPYEYFNRSKKTLYIFRRVFVFVIQNTDEKL
jgi:hypothetical protein